MSRTFSIAVVGAASPVGEAVLAYLHDREFPVSGVHALDSGDALEGSAQYGQRDLTLREVEDFDFGEAELAIFCAGELLAATHVPTAVAAGCTVIDCSTAFRREPDVPLVVAEVNADALAAFSERGIVCVPDAATLALAIVLHPLHQAARVTRVDVVCCVSASASGRAGLDELGRQTAALLGFQEIAPSAFPRQIAFNLLPQVGALGDDGYSRLEASLMRDTARLLGDATLAVNATALAAPVFYGDSLVVRVQLGRALGPDEARDGGFPTAVTDASGSDAVHVGRIRQDLSDIRGLNLWIVTDNVRRGVALNAVQLAEILARDYL